MNEKLYRSECDKWIMTQFVSNIRDWEVEFLLINAYSPRELIISAYKKNEWKKLNIGNLILESYC